MRSDGFLSRFLSSASASQSQWQRQVVGVGGGGGNAVVRMTQQSIPGVEFWCLNTDAQVGGCGSQALLGFWCVVCLIRYDLHLPLCVVVQSYGLGVDIVIIVFAWSW